MTLSRPRSSGIWPTSRTSSRPGTPTWRTTWPSKTFSRLVKVAEDGYVRDTLSNLPRTHPALNKNIKAVWDAMSVLTNTRGHLSPAHP